MRAADATVVGGGAAGAAVAWHLASAGAAVALVHDHRERWRPVGQQLSAAARPVLRSLGVLDALTGAAVPVHEARSAWGGPDVDCRPAIFNPHGPPLAVDRPRLDHLLRAAARHAGARVLDGHARAVRTSDGAWQVWDGTGRRWTTRVLVDATGAGRALTRAHLPWTLVDRLRCVLWQARPAGAAPQPWSLVEADPDGWWYTAPTPGGDHLTVMRVEDMPAATGRPGAPLQPPPHTRDRLADRLPAVCDYRVAVVGYANPPWAPNLVAAGDAALAVDPLSSSGLDNALHLAAPASAAALGLIGGDPGPAHRYAQQVHALAARHLELRHYYLSQPTEYAAFPFWTRRTPTASPLATSR
ncbi:NAD(P)/FAD-dependent oxidoreductase [Actinomadura rugatobispora]|uniref:NAD(P)/FAD-dependent oxidoreductase n=1 Tax=Actinomadura rugatobispora TaxID=1994 RepID=A0ABW1A8G8_9ACTN|nr:tryptophan 7-halogenase [Actinomadura rugatobispora]